MSQRGSLCKARKGEENNYTLAQTLGCEPSLLYKAIANTGTQIFGLYTNIVTASGQIESQTHT